MTHNHHSLTERITRQYARLTEKSRRIADFVQLNPEKILLLSTAEIAESCDVSKTSVSRFIRQLGYEDHLALRQEMIQEREKGTPVLTTDVEDPDIKHDMKALEQLWTRLVGTDVTSLIDTLSHARNIKVIGYRNSYPLAMHFRQQLLQCRPNVDLLPLPGQTVGEDLASVGKDDFVILLGIRRRTSQFESIVNNLAGRPALLITDQSGQKYANRIANVIICHMNNDAPLDSYAAPMSLISYLVNKVFRNLGKEAVKQSSRISHSYSELNEIE